MSDSDMLIPFSCMQRKAANTEAAQWDADGPLPTSARQQTGKDGTKNSSKRGRQEREETSRDKGAGRRRSSTATSATADDEGDAGQGSISSPAKIPRRTPAAAPSARAPRQLQPATRNNSRPK